jgi:hypothetical protein
MKTGFKVTLFVAVIVVAVGLTIWLAYRARKKEADETGATGSVFPLRYGSRGQEVKNVQYAVNVLLARLPGDYDFAPLSVDGIWGDKTDHALRMTFLSGLSDVAVTKEKYDYILSTLQEGNG